MIETEQEKLDRLSIKSHNNSFHSFGKAYIFEKRANLYSRLISILTIMGIIVPVIIGAIVLGYGVDNNLIDYFITLAVPVSIIQLVISLISIVYKWTDQLAYANESAQDHYFLSDRFKKLGEFPPDNFIEADHKFELINTKLKSRIEQDTKHNLKDWELRMGMRYALRENKKACSACKIIPTSMEPTKCSVCGNFENQLKF